MTMTRVTLTDDRSLEHIESGEQCGGAVALVIVCHRTGASLLHRESGLGAVKGLDLRLLVDAEDQGVLWGIEIQPDDVAQLLNEMLVVGQLEGTHQMRFKFVGMPDALHGGVAHPGVLGHGARRPMRGLLGHSMHGVIDNAFDEFSPVVRFSSSPRAVEEAGHALLDEAVPPFRHRVRAGAQLLGDVAVLHALGGQQHDARSEHLAHARTTRAHRPLQDSVFLGGEFNARGATHATALPGCGGREAIINNLNCVTLH